MNIMKRSFFFLKDSVTGKFYTGTCDDLSDFCDAAVFHSEANAKKKLKVHVRRWESTRKGLAYWDNKAGTATAEARAKLGLGNSKWEKEAKDSVFARQDLKDWGIEIVGIEIKAPASTT